MKKLRVYFDFLCPYCFKGVKDLIDLLPEFPDIKVDWMPCEAHPRPEKREEYSDIAAEAVMYLKGHQGNLEDYIIKVYRAHYAQGKRVDDKDILVELAKDCNVEPARLKASLFRRDYKQDVMTNNSDIWDVYCAEAVPSFYFRNKALESKENRIITKEELQEFLQKL